MKLHLKNVPQNKPMFFCQIMFPFLINIKLFKLKFQQNKYNLILYSDFDLSFEFVNNVYDDNL